MNRHGGCDGNGEASLFEQREAEPVLVKSSAGSPLKYSPRRSQPDRRSPKGRRRAGQAVRGGHAANFDRGML
jgi:hypothetical protein